MFRYLAALFDHVVHYKLAPAHLKVENLAALERLKQIDRDIAAGLYEGPDVVGTKAFTFWRSGPRARLAQANRALETQHGYAHLPLENAKVAVDPAPATERSRRTLGASVAYTLGERTDGGHEMGPAPAHRPYVEEVVNWNAYKRRNPWFNPNLLFDSFPANGARRGGKKA